jgi:hypothetical protein
MEEAKSVLESSAGFFKNVISGVFGVDFWEVPEDPNDWVMIPGPHFLEKKWKNKKQAEENFLLNLPEKVLLHIFRYVNTDPRNLKFGIVCSRFYELVNHPHLWSEYKFNTSTEPFWKKESPTLTKLLRSLQHPRWAALQQLEIYECVRMMKHVHQYEIKYEHSEEKSIEFTKFFLQTLSECCPNLITIRTDLRLFCHKIPIKEFFPKLQTFFIGTSKAVDKMSNQNHNTIAYHRYRTIISIANSY